MKNIVFLTLLTSFVFTFGCNKNQNVVNILDGTWETFKVDDAPAMPGIMHSIQFFKCKLRKDELCDALIHNYIDNSFQNYTYRVYNRGNKLSINYLDLATGNSYPAIHEILELEENKLVVRVQVEGGTRKIEYKRI